MKEYVSDNIPVVRTTCQRISKITQYISKALLSEKED